jgi:adenylate cyclase
LSGSQVRRRVLATVVIAIAVGGLCAWGLATDRLDGVQGRWQDLLQPGLAAADDVVIVGIDRGSLEAIGTGWPWPRDLHAELLDEIGDGRPAVVVYDVLFADSRPGDDALIAAIGRTPTVLPTALTLTVGTDGPPEIVDAVAPAEPIGAAAAGLGHANVTNAGDTGVVRTVPLYALDERGVARPSIALAAIAVATGTTGPLTERPDGVQLGDRFVPLDDGELQINWSESLRQADVIPAIDVLNGDVDPAVFRDRYVVVGVTEPTLGDQHLVPVDRSGGTSGVVVLANATNTVLAAGYLSDASSARELALTVIIAVAVAAAFVWLPLVPALLVALAAIAAVVLFGAWRFHADGTLWNVVWPVVAVVLAAGAGTLWRYVAESRHRRRAWRLFATYVPADVVRELEEPSRLAAALAEARCDVTVVFGDIRGFTPLAGSLPPAIVRSLLDTYYEYMVAIVHRHGGTVMQFVGDEVFAVFGAPVANDTAAVDAVRCAVALQDEVGALDERLAAAGLPPVRFGVGVHRGSVVAAHVGTEDRRQYAVVGETVNLGGRLCDVARPGEILASEEAWRSMDPDLRGHFVAGGSIELKGVRRPVAVYRALRALGESGGEFERRAG